MITKSIASFFIVGMAFMAMTWLAVLKFAGLRGLARRHKTKSFLLLELMQSIFHGVSTPSAIAINAGGTVLNALVLGPWAIFDWMRGRRAGEET